MKMSIPEIECKYYQHTNSKICFICINQTCDKKRPACADCLKNLHYLHTQDMLDIIQYNVWRDEGIRIVQQFNNIIKKMESVQNYLKQYTKHKHQEIEIHLSSLTIEQIHNSTSDLLELNKINSILKNDLQLVYELLEQIESKCLQVRPSSKIQIQRDINQFEEDYKQPATFRISQYNRRPIKQSIKTESILQPQIQVKFSYFDKHEDIEITKQGKIAEWKGEIYQEGFCVCEPVITTASIVKFSIKVIHIGWQLCIGVCIQDSIKRAGYKPNLSNIGHGCYLISNEGYMYSHHQQKINQQRFSFSFQNNDEIIVEVDTINQKIQWTKKSTNDIYVNYLIIKRMNLQSFYNQSLSIIVGLNCAKVMIKNQ